MEVLGYIIGLENGKRKRNNKKISDFVDFFQ